MKCNFCDLEATANNRLFVGEVKNGIINWDYYGDSIYTCEKHRFMHTEFDMNGEVIERA